RLEISSHPAFVRLIGRPHERTRRLRRNIPLSVSLRAELDPIAFEELQQLILLVLVEMHLLRSVAERRTELSPASIRRLPPNKLCHLDSRTDDARESIRADLHFDRMSKVPCINGDQSQRVTLNRVQAFAHEIADFLRYFLVDIAQLPTKLCHPRQSATTRLLSQCLSLTCLCQFGTLKVYGISRPPNLPGRTQQGPSDPARLPRCVYGPGANLRLVAALARCPRRRPDRPAERHPGGRYRPRGSTLV